MISLRDYNDSCAEEQEVIRYPYPEASVTKRKESTVKKGIFHLQALFSLHFRGICRGSIQPRIHKDREKGYHKKDPILLKALATLR